MTPMIKLVVKGIETFIIIVCYMFKKAEKSLILGKSGRYFFKKTDPNWASKDKKYTIYF